jgi:hypothetical protein
MRASIAWSAYGIGNGVASVDELVGLIDYFASMNSKKYVAVSDPELGCIELENPVFYNDDEFITAPWNFIDQKYFCHCSEGF